MDIKRKIAYAMITAAIDKGIKDIKENPKRGARNLVDLGMHFSKGQFQKDFFNIAQKILDSESSPYYELVNRTVKNTDAAMLKHFGFNLGYNSWSYGVGKIREYEKRHGYKVPWTLIFNFSNDNENVLSVIEVSDILHSGESMGIFCGMLFAGKNKYHLKSLLYMLKSHKDSSYFLFIQPQLITEEISEIILNAGNIMPVLSVILGDDNTTCRNAAEILFENNCMYGTYIIYDDKIVDFILDHRFLKQIQYFSSAFIFLISKEVNDVQNNERISKFIKSGNNEGKYPFFLIDFCEDLAYVDRIVSGKDCSIVINGNGSITVLNKKAAVEGLNIRTQSLETILRENVYRI